VILIVDNGVKEFSLQEQEAEKVGWLGLLYSLHCCIY